MHGDIVRLCCVCVGVTRSGGARVCVCYAVRRRARICVCRTDEGSMNNRREGGQDYKTRMLKCGHREKRCKALTTSLTKPWKNSFLACLLNILRILNKDQMCRELFSGPSAEYIANSEYGPDVSRDTVIIHVYTFSHTNVLSAHGDLS